MLCPVWFSDSYGSINFIVVQIQQHSGSIIMNDGTRALNLGNKNLFCYNILGCGLFDLGSEDIYENNFARNGRSVQRYWLTVLKTNN